jgi:hypothetical protein
MGQQKYSDLKTQQLMTVWSLNVGLLYQLPSHHTYGAPFCSAFK